MAERTEIRVGLFVVMALLILGVGTLLIVGFEPWRGDQASYEVLLASSGGVRRGDRIRVAGIEVGRVQRIDLLAADEWPVRMRVSVDRDVVLTEGSSARITSDGLLGAPYLEIESGPASAAKLPPGSSLFGRAGSDVDQALERVDDLADRAGVLLDELIRLAGALAEQAGPVLARLQILLSEENTAAISAALAELQETTAEAGPRMSAMLERLDSMAAQLEEGAGNIPELTADAQALLQNLEGAIGSDGERLLGLLDAAERTLTSAGGAFSTVDGNRGEVDAMLRDLRDSAANLKALTQTLKERPALLLRNPRPPDHRPGDEEKP